MAYIKNNWKNQNVERPKTYELSNNEDGTVTLIESFGNVIELGTPVNAENMNRIEKGIEMCELTKYDPNTTYNKGEWVTEEVGGIKSIYSSKIENNFGNPINDNAFWEKIKLGGSSKNIGEIVHSLLPLDDSGLHLLDGALIRGDGVYSEFVSYIANLYGTKDTHPNYFTDEDTWQTSVSQYGVCGKFVYDNENNTVRLPKVTGFLEGTVDLSALGELQEAGLPNITGTVAIVAGGGGASGCFTWGEYSNHINSSVVAGNNGFHFNAALSNPIYGNSNTVQPQSVKGFLYIVLATGVKTEIEVDIDNVINELKNTIRIVDSYQNENSWYQIYSNGWCEQGGLTSEMVSTVTFLKPMKDNTYTLSVTLQKNTYPTTAEGNPCGYNLSKEQAFICSGSSNYGAFWKVEGYIN